MIKIHNHPTRVILASLISRRNNLHLLGRNITSPFQSIATSTTNSKMWKWSGKDKKSSSTKTLSNSSLLSKNNDEISTVSSLSQSQLMDTSISKRIDEEVEVETTTTDNGNALIEVSEEAEESITNNSDTDNKEDELNTSIASGNAFSTTSTSTKDVKASFESVAKMFAGVFAANNAKSDKKVDSSKSSNNNRSFRLREEGQKILFLKASSSSSVSTIGSTTTTTTTTTSTTQQQSTTDKLGGMLLSLLKSSNNNNNNNKDDKKSEQLAITDIVAHIRARIEDVESDEQHRDMGDPNSMKEIFGIFNQYKDLMKVVANKYVGDIDFKKLTPTAIFYYLEKEDEIKNPSWKRRQHRFFDGIDMKQVKSLNDSCEFAMLSYADTVDEIRTALSNTKPYPYELVFAELRSSTGQPASFVAVKNDPSVLLHPTTTNNKSKSKINKKNKVKHLEVIIVVRGTKTAADAFTDLLCDSEPYYGGKAHSFIVTSGIYIADKHRTLLLDLLEKSGASKIDLKFIGHSLGAGAASIAGMEYNNEKSVFYHPNIIATVVGFGCPALVTEELAAKSSSYITTVVNDSDVVPRMSGISVANMLRNALEFDWRQYAKKDLDVTLQQLEKSQPLLFRAGAGTAIQTCVESLLKKYGKDLLLSNNKIKLERLPVELYPPGKVLHFYNDGRGISASFVPNTFFNEIDVTRRMIDDHLFFSGYQATFLAVAREKEQNHHYRFDIDK